jgi:diamine N-acetyltransferase
LFTSFVPGDGSPVGFYLKYGFVPTGEVFDDEPVLELARPRAVNRGQDSGATS